MTGARVGRFVQVRWLLLVAGLVGCGGSHTSADAAQDAYYADNCSWRDSTYGSSTCTDTDSGFWCTCSPQGSSCDYESWENGCSCTCAVTGSGVLYWSCIPDEEFSSPCPIAPPDAGSGM